MEAQAVIFERPGCLSTGEVNLTTPGRDDVVVDIHWSSVSTGTERLLWEGRMPQFPGLGYPLVPGYESVGEIVDAGSDVAGRIGERVFVPGCAAFSDVRGLFGGAASRLVVASQKAIGVDRTTGEDATLMALAATACHAIRTGGAPDLVVGAGVLGRLIARTCVALGDPAPALWESDPARRDGLEGFQVLAGTQEDDANYRCIMDATGKADIIDHVIANLMPGGQIVLAGFYPDRVNFAFPPAFMKEARFAIAAEWQAEDMEIARRLVGDGLLDLSGLISHRQNSNNAQSAYETAFGDAQCLKMVLDWREVA